MACTSDRVCPLCYLVFASPKRFQRALSDVYTKRTSSLDKKRVLLNFLPGRGKLVVVAGVEKKSPSFAANTRYWVNNAECDIPTAGS